VASRPPLIPPTRRWNRRDALVRGMASVTLLSALRSPLTSNRPSAQTSAFLRSSSASALAPFQADLRVPPTLLPVGSTATHDTYRLAIREGLAEIVPGMQTSIYGYEGFYPGPTIRARKGRTTVVHVHNRLPFHQNVHLHGGLVPADVDGHPLDVISPRDVFTYTYPNAQDAATLWYHDHSHGQSAQTVYYGLSGFYLIEDELTDDLELPREDLDVPLLIADRTFDADGSLKYVMHLDTGMLGDTIVVNGSVSPRMPVRRAIYRLRLLNGSNARVYSLQLGDGLPMYQIADDGGLLERPVLRPSIPLSPSERVEVLVDFRDHKAGTELVLTNTLGTDATASVMRFDVVGTARDSGRIPTALRPVESVPPPVTDRTWELMFSTSGTPMWQISGAGFDPDRVDARPKLGTTERWAFVNTSFMEHPMHVHGVHYRVLDRTDGPVHEADRGWKDTYLVPPGETVRIQPYFGSYAGLYVFHCHTLEHQEQSMMRQMEITA
jgi:FtsP/CotA-like multicopper oxidase with cupredoxin domain